MSSIGRTHATSFFLSSFAGISLISGAALSFTAYQALENLTKNGEISVDLSDFAWSAKSTWKGEHASATQVASLDSRLQDEIASQSKFAVATPKALKARRKAIGKLDRRIARVEHARKNTVLDAAPILSADAAPIPVASNGLDSVPVAIMPAPASSAAAPAVVQVAVSPADLPPSDPSPEEMVQAYRSLHARFLVAFERMDSQKEKNTQVAVAIIPPLERKISTPREQEPVDPYAKAVVVEDEIGPTIVATEAQETEEAAQAMLAAVPTAPAMEEAPSLPKKTDEVVTAKIGTTQIDAIPEFATDLQDKVKTSKSSAILATQSAKTEAPRMDSQPSTGPPDPTPIVEKKPESPALAAKLVEPTPSLILPARKIAKDTTPAVDDATFEEDDYSDASRVLAKKKIEYSAVSSQKAASLPDVKAFQPAIAISTHTPQLPNKVTVPTSDGGSIIVKAPDEKAFDESDAMTVAMNQSGDQRARNIVSSIKPESTTEKTIVPQKTCDSALVGREAFSAQTSAFDAISVCRKPLSLEGMKGEGRPLWWEVRSGEGHWSTLIYQNEQSAFDAANRIPMISFNSIKLLALLAKDKIQESMGIVFGEIRPQVEVSLATRSENILYLDSGLRLVEGGDLSQVKYFIYFNVQPGVALLKFRAKEYAGEASAPIVVKSGAATYVGYVAPKTQDVRVRIVSAAKRELTGMAKLTVQLVGQSSKAAVTDVRGYATLKAVPFLGDYPVYLDVAPNEQSFKHRYRLDARRVDGRLLFYFSDEEIAAWTRQLEGGMSPASGLVVGALPKVAASFAKGYLRLGSLEKKTALSPEIYLLGDRNKLVAETLLSRTSSRFVAVQVSEGANVPTVFDEHGTMLWSELIVSQPGVLNVVGSY